MPGVVLILRRAVPNGFAKGWRGKCDRWSPSITYSSQLHDVLAHLLLTSGAAAADTLLEEALSGRVDSSVPEGGPRIAGSLIPVGKRARLLEGCEEFI